MWRAANAVISGLVVVASVIVVAGDASGITVVLAFGPYEKPQPPGFSAADIKDLRSLTKKFEARTKPALAFLWERLSEPARQAMTDLRWLARAQAKALKAAAGAGL